MPVHVARLRGKYRIVDHAGDIETTPRGHARDGGGFKTREEALRQMRAINASLEDSAEGKSDSIPHPTSF